MCILPDFSFPGFPESPRPSRHYKSVNLVPMCKVMSRGLPSMGRIPRSTLTFSENKGQKRSPGPSGFGAHRRRVSLLTWLKSVWAGKHIPCPLKLELWTTAAQHWLLQPTPLAPRGTPPGCPLNSFPDQLVCNSPWWSLPPTTPIHSPISFSRFHSVGKSTAPQHGQAEQEEGGAHGSAAPSPPTTNSAEEGHRAGEPQWPAYLSQATAVFPEVPGKGLGRSS